MFNQEQLAAIAAAMSVLQHSLRSNSPTSNSVTNQSTINTANNANANNGGPLALHLQQISEQADLTGNGLQSVAGLRALAQLEWQQQQQQQQRQQLQQQQQSLDYHFQSQLQQADLRHTLAASPPKQQPQALLNHYHHHNHQAPLQQSDLQLTPSPPNQQSQLLLPTHQQQQQHHHQQHLHHQPPQHHLQQQQHQQQQQQHQQQQQQQVLAHYQPQLQQQSDLHIAPAQPPLKQQQQPQQQQVLTNKPTKPESYSAIVAKSAGLAASNNIIGFNNCNNSNSSSGNGAISSTNGTSVNVAASACNYAFGGLNNNSTTATPINALATNNSFANNSDTTSNATNNTTKLRNIHTLRGVGLPNVIGRNNSLTNHIVANSTNNIFNTNNLTGYNGLGHPNGSLLNHHSNLLALEPTINYTTDHSTSPAQQLFNHTQSLSQNHHQISIQKEQPQHNHHQINPSSLSTITPSPGSATNLLGFMGLYVGNLSPDLTKEQLEKLFSKYGEPVKAHRLIRSPVAFIKYENTESPRAAIDDLYGLLLPELTLNQDQPLKLHFDRNDAQLKANYRPTELPPKSDNGECYGWRTTVCRRGKNCPKKHIPINRGIDFQMWMIKSAPTTTS